MLPAPIFAVVFYLFELGKDTARLYTEDMETQTSFWDPVEMEITSTTFDHDTASLKRKFNYYRSHPWHLRMWLAIWVLVVLAGVSFDVWVFRSGGGTVISLMSLFAFFIYLHVFQTDLAKMAAAHDLGWVYSPNIQPDRWETLEARYPEMFDKGNSGQCLSGEFWGALQGERASTPFWLGRFDYTVGSGKNSQTYTETVFAYQMGKSVPADFSVAPENVFTRLWDRFANQDIDLESNAFNSRFHIVYKGRKSDVDEQVFESLNPLVMSTLMDFREACGPFTLIFRGDVALVSLPGEKFVLKHTNFIRKVSVDQRDVDRIMALLQQALEFANQISYQLD